MRDALCSPPPVQARLPLLIGGKGDRMLGVVARDADQWNKWGLPPVLAGRGRGLRRALLTTRRVRRTDPRGPRGVRTSSG
ncbi:MAG: LLM class F420-dependent oxidoreductase, partial [Rhizobiaceae bacterium]|nr:LLM class F420-dependent oxidoreductase [Rhizobiaceae bacterium]